MPEHASARTLNAPPPVPRGRLWFALVAPPIAWIGQGAFGWLAAARICESLSIGAVRWIVGLLSLAMLVIAVVAAIVAWGNWGLAAAAPKPTHVEAWDRVEFMSAGGFLVSAVFIIAIVWAGLGSAMLNGCGGMR